MIPEKNGTQLDGRIRELPIALPMIPERNAAILAFSTPRSEVARLEGSEILAFSTPRFEVAQEGRSDVVAFSTPQSEVARHI